jgi:hypothetical protein
MAGDLLTYGQSAGFLKKALGFELHDGQVGVAGMVASVAGSRKQYVKLLREVVLKAKA